MCLGGKEIASWFLGADDTRYTSRARTCVYSAANGPWITARARVFDFLFFTQRERDTQSLLEQSARGCRRGERTSSGNIVEIVCREVGI